MEKKLRYFSLFSGIGGFELGIQKAYVDISRGSKKDSEIDYVSRQRLDCVGYSEIDKYAVSIYQKHFPNHKNYGDIKTIDKYNLPDFDLLIGGFPCQAFSIAGLRRGFDDTRGTLFFDIARILREKRPRLFLLENVKGLLSHDNGRTFKTIITTLDELGYDTEWQVLNSKDFGVPQNRERVFIVGHLRGTPRPEVFPITESDKKYIRQADIEGCASTLTGRSAGGQNRRGNYIVKTFRSNKSGLQKVRQFSNSSYRRGGQTYPSHIRRLTPLECERLQGFPDNWTTGESDTQRYKMAGNAVTVNVVEAIMKKLLTCG